MTVYLHYNAAELERQYDVTIGVDDAEGIQDRYRRASEAVVASGLGNLDVAYGPDALQRLDLFPAGGGATPVMVYIHGGYWKGGDKAGRRFPAPLFNSAGIAWVPINYRLTPKCGIDDIVDDVRTALAWIYRNAPVFGADPERIFVSGSSAGGHLTGMVLAPGWHADYDLPENVVKGACAMSGVFDLEPMRQTSHQETLALDEAAMARNSPIRHPPKTSAPIVVAWGAKESDEFARQSGAYAAALEEAGCTVSLMPVEDHDHFSLMGEMGRSTSPIALAMLGLAAKGA